MLLTLDQVAEILQVNKRTVLKSIKCGRRINQTSDREQNDYS